MNIISEDYETAEIFGQMVHKSSKTVAEPVLRYNKNEDFSSVIYYVL